MKKRICVYLFSVISILIIGSITVSAVSEPIFNWYCKRNKEHKQPIADASMQWIETYGGYYIDPQHGDNDKEKVVYLTFDAGYENGNIGKILDIMKEEQVTGAFFVLSHLVTSHPDLIKRMADEGHIVANHTAHHKDMTKLDDLDAVRKELDTLNDLYREVTGKELAKYYRPPEGKFDRQSLSFVHQLGYKTVFWSLAYADWDNEKQPSSESAMNTLMTYMHNGAVILLHPTSATNSAILEEFIQALKEQGYQFGTLDELTQA